MTATDWIMIGASLPIIGLSVWWVYKMVSQLITLNALSRLDGRKLPSNVVKIRKKA